MKRLLLPLLLFSALCLSCARQEYDISEGVNKEVTLFENEISAPLGSLSPITIGSTLSGLSKVGGLGGMVADYIKVAEDGSLILEDENDLFRINVYELEKSMADASTPETWSAGYQSAFMGGMAPLLGLLGIETTNQKIVISVSNPLSVNVPARCDATVNVMGDTTYSAPVAELNALSLSRRSTVEVATVTVPNDIKEPVTFISFSNIQFDLPANPTSKISDDTGNLFFAFTYHYSCGATIGPDFDMPLVDLSTGALNLNIGKYKVKKCVLHAEIENSVPIAVTVDSVNVLKPKVNEGDPDEVDTNIKVSQEVTVAGGSLENPATSVVSLTIEALEGTVPDIPELLLSLHLKAQPGMGDVALSANQSIILKSVSAKLYGGITIPEE